MVSSWRRTAGQTVPTQQVLVFSLATVQLGIPLEQVQKVVARPTIVRSGEQALGLSHFGDQEILALDLHRIVHGRPAATPLQHLIVLRSPSGEFYGLAVSELPNLMAVPVDRWHPIPEAYRRQDPLGVARQVAQVTQGETEETLFRLDLADLLPLFDPCLRG
ncbi:MAG: chemotaxis protein CheW [Gloeomargaritaceae cyanobacterium C42_A2020_066]|nr:chemotaxis protein CheW [Gloeomargaritaceae cyanobacterium C42_A2020_066]